MSDTGDELLVEHLAGEFLQVTEAWETGIEFMVAGRTGRYRLETTEGRVDYGEAHLSPRLTLERVTEIE